MSASVGAGLALALGSAAALNWSYVTQHGAASALPPLSLRRPLRSLALLFRHPRWLLGFFVGIGGWVLYVAALRLAPLSLVQSVSAGGIGILALLASRGGATLERREKAGVAAGIFYAAGDVGTKAAVAGGTRLLFVPALLACHGLAFVALQLGFQRGKALATAGVATLFTNSLPIVAGMAVFHEGIPGGAAGLARVTAFVAVVVGAAALARPERPAEVLRPVETSA